MREITLPDSIEALTSAGHAHFIGNVIVRGNDGKMYEFIARFNSAEPHLMSALGEYKNKGATDYVVGFDGDCLVFKEVCAPATIEDFYFVRGSDDLLRPISDIKKIKREIPSGRVYIVKGIHLPDIFSVRPVGKIVKGDITIAHSKLGREISIIAVQSYERIQQKKKTFEDMTLSELASLQLSILRLARCGVIDIKSLVSSSNGSAWSPEYLIRKLREVAQQKS